MRQKRLKKFQSSDFAHAVPAAVVRRCLNKRRIYFSSSCGLHLPLNNHRKREGKRRALARLRLDPDLAAVHLDDALRYGEAQAGAALLARNCIIGLLKLLE